MNVLRAMVPMLLATVAACASRPAETAPKPLIPLDGPKGSIRVFYDGGLFNRRVSASFHVDQPAYVLVAHLGGDGVIRVLYPEDGRANGYVDGNRTFRTKTFNGNYDAAPNYWFMGPAAFRNLGARHSSYDGRGHGFVFMITSSRPLEFGRVSELGLWNDIELEVREYSYTTDPRFSIRAFADLVAGGRRYALRYATSYSSYSSYSYADARMDCAIFSSGFGLSRWFTGFDLGSRRSSYGSLLSSCGRSNRFAFGNYGFDSRPAVASGGPALPPVNIPVHRIPRPGRRADDPGRSFGFTHATFAQPPRPAASGWDRWDRWDRSVRGGMSSPFGGHTPVSAQPRPGTASSSSGAYGPATPPPVSETAPAQPRQVELKPVP